MPVFDYICKTCNHTQETRVKSHDTPVECPKCQSPMTKLIGAPTFILKGKDWSSNGSYARAKEGPKIDKDIFKLSDADLNRECGLPENIA